MRFTAFHIDKFGLFTNTSCEHLSPRANVFYGCNEAGKSTCLEFIRAMLTGFSEAPNFKKRFLEYKPGEKPGGCLLFRCKETTHELKICRTLSMFGGSNISAVPADEIPSEKLWEFFHKSLGDINRRAYQEIFGFSLAELQTWNKRTPLALRSALHGASFGPGLASPREAISVIQHKIMELGGESLQEGSIQRSLEKLDALDKRIAGLKADNSAYDSMCIEAESIAGQKSELKQKNIALEQERLVIERRLLNWQNWQKWKSLRDHLAELPEVSADFPADAANRLTALINSRQHREQDLASAEIKLDQAKARRDATAVNVLLLDKTPDLQDLASGKALFEKARKDIPELQSQQKRLKKDLEACLAKLGPEWSCEHIRSLDRSLFARENMEKSAAEMTAARLASQVATNTLAVITHETEAIRQALVENENALSNLPEPEAILSGDDRDFLREKMAQMDRDRRMAEARQKSIQSCRRLFERSIAQTQLFPGDGQHALDKKAAILKKLLEKKGEAQHLADELKSRLAQCEDIQRRIDQATDASERLRTRIDEMYREQNEAGPPDRENIDARMRAVRTLRNIYASTENEEERKKELDARIAMERKPKSIKNWASLTFAILFFIASAVIFVAHWHFGIQQIDFGGDMALPINLWAAYVSLLCGVILFATGFSGSTPERKRQKKELDSLLARREASTMHLAELAAQSQSLCKTAGIENLDDVALDAMEMLLERKKEQLFREEQTRRAANSLEDELANASRETGALREEAHNSHTAAQQCRRQWHALMQGIDLPTVPSPESAETIFTRSEAALIAYDNLKEAESELEALHNAIADARDELASLPFIKRYNQEYGQPIELETCVIQLLEKCSDADAIREQRKAIQIKINSAIESLKRAEARQQQAEAEMENRNAMLEEADKNWVECITALGLDARLTPETAREAYAFMRDCLDYEDRLEKTACELDQARTMVDSLLLKFNRIRAELGNAGEVTEENWLSELNDCLNAANANMRSAEQKNMLALECESRGDEISALQAALQKAMETEKELIGQGGSASADEFLHKAAIHAERNEISQKIKDMEHVLAQSSPEMNLEEFIASFEKDDEPANRLRLETIQKDLENGIRELEKLAYREGILLERINSMANDEELAITCQKRNILVGKITQMADEWGSLVLARDIIKAGAESYEKEKQPELVREAAKIFSGIAGDHWTGLRLDFEKARLMAANNEMLAPLENLSRGTQEQAYLSLRLAFICRHAQTSEPLPMIMDEVLVNFDPQRARRAACELARITSVHKQQMLYFTCQPTVVDMLKEAFDDIKIYLVEDNTIRAA